ncbi:MAG: TetR/AcrR family transcriptional regulator [Balneolales bacterium]
MKQLEEETEEKIFLAAQHIFQAKGFQGARMQEIADKAGINKSMLHYYYRNKDTLFLKVFQTSLSKIMPELFTILSSKVPLEQKVNQIVDFYYGIFEKNHHLPSFVIYEMNRNPQRFKDFVASMDVKLPEHFAKQIQEAVSSGKIMAIAPHQFLINVVSLCMMPVIARVMVQTLFKLNDAAYRVFLEERKELIPKIIFSGVQPP